jgi:hypothetical protein
MDITFRMARNRSMVFTLGLAGNIWTGDIVTLARRSQLGNKRTMAGNVSMGGIVAMARML